jgi:deoxyribodipyrimidine photo-lyase
MREMVHTGIMHNDMRMYWAKKDPGVDTRAKGPFSEHPGSEQQVLSGRPRCQFLRQRGVDLGVHDRPWPERPVFRQGAPHERGCLERKFDMAAYLRAVDGPIGAERR